MDNAGKYELSGIVADRPHGRVWKGRDPDLDRTVAIKEVDARDATAVDRLRSEARVLAGLSHEHIVEVYDVVEDDGKVWLVEEWVDGASLDVVLGQARRLSPQQAVGVVRGALTGLAAAHERGLVHGDVTPGNILLDQQGVSKLVDFGLAGPAGAPGIAGTPGYLSPEQSEGEAVTSRSDVYSAAVVLASLLKGEPLFPVTTTAETAGRQLAAEPDLSRVGGRVREVLARALDRDPEARHADAGELLGDLEEAAERDFGAGWLAQAGVAALVTAAVTAGAVRVTSGQAVAAPAGGGGAEPVRQAGRAGRLGRASTRAKVAMVGGAAVVTAGVVAIVAVAAVGGTHPARVLAAPTTTAATPTASATPSPSAAAPSPTVAAATSAGIPTTAAPTTTTPVPVVTYGPDQIFAGRFRVAPVVKHVNGTWSDVVSGQAGTATIWTITATCHTTCTAVAKSSSGKVFHFTYANGAWTTSLLEPEECASPHGKVLPPMDVKFVVHTGAGGSTKKPASFKGSGKFTLSADDPPETCTGVKGQYYTETLTLTRR